MPSNIFDKYISEINTAYLRGDSTEHTHRPALKALVEVLSKKITATNEPSRIECGAPDFIVSRIQKRIDQTIGYIECKDIGKDLKSESKTEQIKKRYLPSLHNFIFTDYIEFWWYVDGEKRLTAKLAEERKGTFRITEKGQKDLAVLFDCFFAQETQRISTAKELAIKMAHKAQMMRDVIAKTFDKEREAGPLHGQFEGFKEVLLHDLSEQEFADMYAQTISYGLFTARCHIDEITLYGKDKHAVFHGMNGKTGEFTREHAAFMLPKTNPFLRSVFSHIAGPDLDDRVAWLVDDLVELLRLADMSQVLRDFAKKKGRRDPVVHFYETFLAEYDPKMRKKRGVYYTPDEVVSYIVRSVDWLLKEKFGIKRGLADESKVTIDGKETHKVLILDPAVGTGTFLFEVIELIHSRFKRQKGMWSSYVREHLLPRLFGFEIQMAPYAVCHMKLGLELAETGYDFESDERLGIYLTNTLEEAEEISKNVFVQWLSEEAREANRVKKDLPIMVVTGNPPYAGISANQGDWINGLLASYREVNGRPLGEKKVWVKNDYVKFIRFGQWRIEQTEQGILAFITDHSYLDSPTFRGMRRNLMKTFDEIYLLNLHGNSKRKEISPDGGKDENVFDILQGTAICVFVKYSAGDKAQVFYADLWGKRSDKYTSLSQSSAEHTEWEKIKPQAPFYEFVPVDAGHREEYDKGWKVTDVFRTGSNGVQTSRDHLVVALTEEELRSRFARIRDMRIEDNVFRRELGVEDKEFWKFAKARESLVQDAAWDACIWGYTYRPFDRQYLFASKAFVHRLRYEVMRHLSRENKGMCVGRAGLVLSTSWDLVFCVGDVCDHNLFYRGSSFNMPLYLYPAREQSDMDYENWPRGKHGRIPNLNREFIEELAEQVKLSFMTDMRGDLEKNFGPEDVFEYIYGLFYAPEYRSRYAEFLKIDFPRIVWPKNKRVFVQMCNVGRQLVELHLLRAAVLENESRWPVFGEEGNNVVEAGYPKYVAEAQAPGKERVFINKGQYFERVKLAVWEFRIGGYQACEKWLKNRRGRELSYDDINHYQKIVVALSETIRLMKEVDEVIDAHGGWPIK